MLYLRAITCKSMITCPFQYPKDTSQWLCYPPKNNFASIDSLLTIQQSSLGLESSEIQTMIIVLLIEWDCSLTLDTTESKWWILSTLKTANVCPTTLDLCWSPRAFTTDLIWLLNLFISLSSLFVTPNSFFKKSYSLKTLKLNMQSG